MGGNLAAKAMSFGSLRIFEAEVEGFAALLQGVHLPVQVRFGRI